MVTLVTVYIHRFAKSDCFKRVDWFAWLTDDQDNVANGLRQFQHEFCKALDELADAVGTGRHLVPQNMVLPALELSLFGTPPLPGILSSGAFATRVACTFFVAPPQAVAYSVHLWFEIANTKHLIISCL